MSQGIDKGAFLSIKLIRVNDFSRLSGFTMNDFSPVGLFVESQVDGQLSARRLLPQPLLGTLT
jgi:hypothetical protein